MPYIYCDQQKIEVSVEVKRAIDNLTKNVHRRAVKAEECPDSKKASAHCEGDCFRCKYWRHANHSSIDAFAHHPSKEIANPTGESQYRIIELLHAMQSVDPDGARIGQMIADGLNSTDISEALGIPESTYRYRLKRIQTALQK